MATTVPLQSTFFLNYITTALLFVALDVPGREQVAGPASAWCACSSLRGRRRRRRRRRRGGGGGGEEAAAAAARGAAACEERRRRRPAADALESAVTRGQYSTQYMLDIYNGWPRSRRSTTSSWWSRRRRPLCAALLRARLPHLHARALPRARPPGGGHPRRGLQAAMRYQTAACSCRTSSSSRRSSSAASRRSSRSPRSH